MGNISLLLVDDHDVVRQGLKALLSGEPDLVIVGEARSGREGVRLASELRPDVVVMDLAMPLLNGWEATRQLVRDVPSTRVIVLSSYDSSEYVQQAMAAGASGYLNKHAAPADLLRAIHEVKNGNTFFDSSIAQQLADPVAQSAETALTPREAEVLQLIAEGFANKQIAGELGLSVKTVEKHRQQVMNKLGIHDTAGLVRHAVAKGVIETHTAGVPTL